ncbi:MAG: HigA family addiction module antidote protein [Deltaproteobacteria bacterium]|nr:HigA family addiction module antidote protein [Deltaproteobacteria bacterium]
MRKKIGKLDLIPPGEILSEEFMKPAGLSINQLARDIDVPPGRISEIISGKRAITADTALRLGKYFGVSPEVWLNLQAEFDLRVARRTTWPCIESRVRVRVA